jgi:hypothetical protein
MINPEKFCLAPFVQVVCRTNKTINPCCYYDNNKTNLQIQTIQQAWLGPEFQTLRETMIDETKTDPQCEKSCYNLEKQGMNTERLGLFQRHSPLEIEQAVNFGKLEKSNLKDKNHLETAFHGLYMKLLLKLQKKDISSETEEAFDSMRILVAYLSRAYHKMKNGDLDFLKN